MAKRLFNEFGAYVLEGSVPHIERIIEDAVEKIWDMEVMALDRCPRDVEYVCHARISSLFAEKILKQAMSKKRGLTKVSVSG